jgi:hypothetical protein
MEVLMGVKHRTTPCPAGMGLGTPERVTLKRHFPLSSLVKDYEDSFLSVESREGLRDQVSLISPRNPLIPRDRTKKEYAERGD